MVGTNPTPQWQQLIQQLLPGSFPSEIQEKTLTQGQLLTTRRNLILNAPTNSGKTLLAYLALFRAAIEEKRALLLVPPRAIAEEKYEELTQLEHSLKSVFGKKIGVTISTGAYRLDEESLQSPPPDEGEVIVATPERIECILRNPEFDSWSESMGVVCIDEAHLLGDRIRDNSGIPCNQFHKSAFSSSNSCYLQLLEKLQTWNHGFNHVIP